LTTLNPVKGLLLGIGVVFAIIASLLLLRFGTISPCGILRGSVRQHDELAAVLPDGLIDVGIIAQYGALSPGRCLALLIQPNDTKSANPTVEHAPPRPQAQQPVPQHNNTKAQMDVAARQAQTAINDCKQKRLRGELHTYAESANCSNQKIIAA
jgi:hypothetical protein